MSAVEERRQRLVDLFYAMDTDLNGMLDVEEFREAMRKVCPRPSGTSFLGHTTSPHPDHAVNTTSMGMLEILVPWCGQARGVPASGGLSPP